MHNEISTLQFSSYVTLYSHAYVDTEKRKLSSEIV